jgi:glutathione synthase/RimK-type ligase-like ATP-grasp enzyme
MVLSEKVVATIGSIELIDFPDLQLEKIPAKIDTGADSSAVWASDVTVNGKILSYCLFGPGSAFYTGEVIKTEIYKVTRVRNSFGHEEFRYKAKLRIKIGQKRLLSWFTLADRSQNTFPVLLGKNFLKTRFIVDVSRKHVLQPNIPFSQVTVFSNQPELNQTFFNKVLKQQTVPTTYTNLSYDSLIYHLEPRNVSVLALPGAEDIANNDLVYLKTHEKNVEQAKALAEYLRYKAVRFISHEISNDSSTGKLSEYMRLAVYDIPIPTSIGATSALIKDRYDELCQELGAPFVLKESSSDRGKNNFLIESSEVFSKVLSKAEKHQVYIVQCFIINDGYLRILVTGREIAMAIKRTPHVNKDPLKAHLNQPAGGINASLVRLDEIPAEVQDICIRAAAVMQREIAGIDIIQDRKTKKWYVLEVNNAPQIRSGALVDEKIKALAAYFDHELNH